MSGEDLVGDSGDLGIDWSWLDTLVCASLGATVQGEVCGGEVLDVVVWRWVVSKGV